MLIKKIEKNTKEKITINTGKYKGNPLIDIRVCIENENGELIPTRKGIAINPRLIKEVIEGLKAAGKELVKGEGRKRGRDSGTNV